jgi:diguanylate cyclase (GGDEF)-like protein
LARFGLAASRLSPKVRAAFDVLMAENALLRAEAGDLAERLALAETAADFDPLTPVRNRRAFLKELTRAQSYCARYGGQSAVLFVDMDGFKRINDQYGHAAGDAALIHIASLLQSQVRDSDVVGRIGGDEFALILARAAPEEARRKADQLVRLIAETPALFEDQELRLAASIGVHVFDGAALNEAPLTLLARADEAMFLEKTAGARVSRV